MSAEKVIVNFWLHQKGFLTVNNITAGNKDIDIIAIGFKDNKLIIQHVDVSCSVSSSIIDTKNINENVTVYINNNFEDKLIIETINNYIRDYCGENKEYEKIAVLSAIPEIKKKEILESFKNNNVDIYEFEDILNDVIINLDTHYYRNDTIRTLQLIKYLLISSPNKLSKLLKNKEMLKHHHKGEFLRNLLKEDKTRKSLGKLSTEPELAGLLKYSSLTNPKILAKMIAEELLGERSKRKFLNALLGEEKMRDLLKELVTEKEIKGIDKNQKLLQFYLNEK
jgi:hypothetical protein